MSLTDCESIAMRRRLLNHPQGRSCGGASLWRTTHCSLSTISTINRDFELSLSLTQHQDYPIARVVHFRSLFFHSYLGLILNALRDCELHAAGRHTCSTCRQRTGRRQQTWIWMQRAVQTPPLQVGRPLLLHRTKRNARFLAKTRKTHCPAIPSGSAIPANSQAYTTRPLAKAQHQENHRSPSTCRNHLITTSHLGL